MKVKAEVNHGRWIANCPNCGGAEVVKLGQPFSCRSMLPAGFHGESAVCGFTAEVEFPEDKLAIEQLLVRRSLANRNWIVGEKLEDLRQENIEHGLTRGILRVR